jgi:hypothetical protein
MNDPISIPSPDSPTGVILRDAQKWRQQLHSDVHEQVVEAIYSQAARLTNRCVSRPERRADMTVDRWIDRIVTSRTWGFPVMLLLFAGMLWLTISGANVPSQLLASLLLDEVHPWLREACAAVGLPVWFRGLLVDGMYLATAWVISVMLPPMMIFFPIFTLLEDFGYLPRVAFNLDRLFKTAGAHGKQAMTTVMGFGCNAAGVVSTRIIDSPRERLIAILTNNFALCNGRWPTQFLIASVFLGGSASAGFAGWIPTAAVTGVALLGLALTLAVAWLLSRTWLQGEVSTFSLELPPYRPPRFLQTLYTSIIDRTLFVLWRAVVFALPAGALIWLVANVKVGEISVAEHLIHFLNPAGVDGAEWRHPAGLYHRHSGKRNRDPLRAHADGAGHQVLGSRRRRRGDVRAGFAGIAEGAPTGRRMDTSNRDQPDAVQSAAQPLQHHHLHDLQGDRQLEVDHFGNPSAPGHGNPGNDADGLFLERSGLVMEFPISPRSRRHRCRQGRRPFILRVSL